MQRTGDSQAQVRYSMAGQSRGWVMLSAVYTVHKEMKSTSFLVEPQNQGRRFIPVWPQNRWLRFISGLASKPPGPVSRFGPQNL
jgi:hypothetical protein